MDTQSTPTLHDLPFRAADFSTLSEALDYAAQGETGTNFYTGRGELYAVLPFAELRARARLLARKLLGMGLEKGDHVALIAETNPEFLQFFFACQYAGLVPVALPASIKLGGHATYVKQLGGLLASSQAVIAMAPEGYLGYLEEAGEGLGLRKIGTPADFDSLPDADVALPESGPEDVAYIQYTSGSTKFPRGVVIKQRSVMSNLAGIIRHGVKIGPGDRCFSWLPFYHDMGLVGFVLGPIASQLSVDYLSTRDFAMRPRQWLALMTKSKATISFSPSFGYELCVRRLGEESPEQFDLSHWRIAGAGAETIRADSLLRFASTLQASGFKKEAFLACYGMAECSLAISFAPLNQGLDVDLVDGDWLSNEKQAIPVTPTTTDKDTIRCSSFVNCGVALPGYEVEIRDTNGFAVGERHSGTIFVRGASTMSGYFNAPAMTQEVLSSDGWLNTGDIGYWINNSLVIIGRSKDLIIIKGRNILPQDLEFMAEQQPEVRPGDSSAFSVSHPEGDELAVMVIQCRESNSEKREHLVNRLRSLVYSELSIPCHIELIPPRTLPRTSSGKLSRSRAKADFLKRVQWEELAALANIHT